MNIVVDETLPKGEGDIADAFTVEDEDQAIHDLLQQLELLLEARGTIDSNGLVSREQVKDLVEEVGLELPDEAPINSFTEAPSATNLTIAQESILESAKNVLKTILAKTIEILRKMLTWLRSVLDPFLGYSKNYAALREYTTLLFDLDNEIARALAAQANAMNTLQGKELQAYEKLVSKADEVKKIWDESWTELRAELLTQGPVYICLEASAQCIHQTFKEVLLKLMLVEAVLSECQTHNLNQADVKHDVMEKLLEAVNPINSLPYVSAARQIHFTAIHTPAMMLAAPIDWMSNEMSRMASVKPHPIMEPRDLGATIVGARLRHQGDHGFMAKATVQVTDGEVHLNALDVQRWIKDVEPQLEKIRQLPPPAEGTGQIAPIFRNALGILLSEFSSCRRLIGMIVRANNDIYRAYGEMSTYMTSYLNMQMILLRANGETEEIKRIEGMIDAVKGSLKLS